jgi:hypothetical protein
MRALLRLAAEANYIFFAFFFAFFAICRPSQMSTLSLAPMRED